MRTERSFSYATIHPQAIEFKATIAGSADLVSAGTAAPLDNNTLQVRLLSATNQSYSHPCCSVFDALTRSVFKSIADCTLQEFPLASLANVDSLTLHFPASTDPFGRITVYRIDVRGTPAE